MGVRYKGVVFARDGSNYEGVSKEVTVLHFILQYESPFSNVMFHNLAYVDMAFVLRITHVMTS
jgi:hypothetical protein